MNNDLGGHINSDPTNVENSRKVNKILEELGRTGFSEVIGPGNRKFVVTLRSATRNLPTQDIPITPDTAFRINGWLGVNRLVALDMFEQIEYDPGNLVYTSGTQSLLEDLAAANPNINNKKILLLPVAKRDYRIADFRNNGQEEVIANGNKSSREMSLDRTRNNDLPVRHDLSIPAFSLADEFDTAQGVYTLNRAKLKHSINSNPTLKREIGLLANIPDERWRGIGISSFLSSIGLLVLQEEFGVTEIDFTGLTQDNYERIMERLGKNRSGRQPITDFTVKNIKALSDKINRFITTNR